MGLYREKLRNSPVVSHKAKGYQILHVAFSIGPLPRMCPRVEFISSSQKFYVGLYDYTVESLEIFLLLSIRTGATNFNAVSGI